jgi:InaD-like protein
VKRYGELGGVLHLVELERTPGSTGLGLSLSGNRNPSIMSSFVVAIQPDSVAAADGRIQVGDELMEINGHVLYGRSHLNASTIVKGVNTPRVRIVLLRCV